MYKKNKLIGTSRHDLLLSFFFSPAPLIISTTLSFALYPIMLGKGGIALVGLWALMQTIIMVVNIVSSGFEQTLIRLVSNKGNEKLTYSIVCGTLFICCILGIFLSIFLPFISPFIVGGNFVENRNDPLIPAFIILAFASVTILGGNIIGSIVKGSQRFFLYQFVQSANSLLQSCFIIFAIMLFDRPILWMATATLAAAACRFAMLTKISYRIYSMPGFIVPSYRYFSQLRKFLRDASGFITLSISQMILSPLFRVLLGAIAGMESLGVFSIADKIPFTLRELFGSGFQASFAFFSKLNIERDKVIIVSRIATSLKLILIINIGLIGSYYILADTALYLWLGMPSSEMVVTTRILSVWWLITSFNIPFWWVAQALGYEGVLGRLILLHSMLMVGAFVYLFLFMTVSAISAASAFLATGIVYQIGFYWYLEKRTGLVIRVLKSDRINILILAIIFLVLFIIIRPLGTLPDDAKHQFDIIGILVFLLVWTGFLLLITRGNPWKLMMELKGGVSIKNSEK